MLVLLFPDRLVSSGEARLAAVMDLFSRQKPKIDGTKVEEVR
jgi:hypothetical protein